MCRNCSGITYMYLHILIYLGLLGHVCRLKIILLQGGLFTLRRDHCTGVYCRGNTQLFTPGHTAPERPVTGLLSQHILCVSYWANYTGACCQGTLSCYLGTCRSKSSLWKRYSVKYSTVQYSTVQYSTVQYSTAQHSTAQHSTAQHSTDSTVQYSTDSTVQYRQYSADSTVQTVQCRQYSADSTVQTVQTVQ